MKIPKDKVGHFVVGAGIALTLRGCGLAPWQALGMSSLAGILKEVTDMTGRGTPDFWDLVATILGGLALAWIPLG